MLRGRSFNTGRLPIPCPAPARSTHGCRRPCARTVLVATNSMREQRRHGHVPGDVTRGATKDEFAHARMTVRAHHEEIRIEVRESRQDLVAHADIRRDRGPYGRLDAVPCQRSRNGGVWAHTALVAPALDLENMHVLRPLQQGESVEDR